MWAKVCEYFQKRPEICDLGTKYALDVLTTDKYLVSNYVLKACKRFLLYRYRCDTDSSFPFLYDSQKVKLAYVFFEVQIIPESGKPYILAPYRAFMLSVIIGLRYKSDPEKLITREVMDTEARKNGKSTFWSIFALYVTCGFLGDFLPKVFICGPGDTSSKILYELASNLINRNPLLKNEFVKVNRDVIQHQHGGQCYKLPFEKNRIEGQNPTLGILTEFHLHPDNRMQESLRTAVNMSRKNQLIIYDTTKGQDIDVPYFQQEQTFKSFLDQQIEHPEKLMPNYHIFLFCAELDVDKYDDWKNSKLWAMANPNVGITLSIEDMEQQFQQLVNKMDLVDFKVKKIGMWINQSDAYFEYNHFLESQRANEAIYKEWFINTTKYKELNSIVGIDLSNVKDTTAVVSTFEIPQPDGESIWILKHNGFIPREKAQEKERMDRVPYIEWKEKGWCTFTSGEVIDFNIVANYIEGLSKQYQIKKIAYDKWGFRYIEDKIKDRLWVKEDDLVEVRQGVALTPSIKEFERKLLLKKIYIIDFNAMLLNHFLNISVKVSKQANENVYAEKLNHNSRIDGAMAAFTALFERCNVISHQSNELNTYIIGGN